MTDEPVTDTERDTIDIPLRDLFKGGRPPTPSGATITDVTAVGSGDTTGDDDHVVDHVRIEYEVTVAPCPNCGNKYQYGPSAVGEFICEDDACPVESFDYSRLAPDAKASTIAGDPTHPAEDTDAE